MGWRDAAVEAHLIVARVADTLAPNVWWACPVCVWLEFVYWLGFKEDL